MNRLPWLADEGAPAKVLRELESAVGLLPTSYLALLAEGNGGEVGLRVSPFVLCLDSAEVALEYWNSHAYTAEGVFVFGGNGGGSLLAFDLRVPGRPVVEFDPIDPLGSMVKVADNLEALLELTEAA